MTGRTKLYETFEVELSSDSRCDDKLCGWLARFEVIAEDGKKTKLKACSDHKQRMENAAMVLTHRSKEGNEAERNAKRL